MKHVMKTAQNALLAGLITAVLTAPVYARDELSNISTGVFASEATTFKERPATMGPNGIRSSGLHLAESLDKKISAAADLPWERFISSYAPDSSYAPRLMQTINQDSVPKLGMAIWDSSTPYVHTNPTHLYHPLPVEFEGTNLEVYHSLWRWSAKNTDSGKQVDAFQEYIFEVEVDGIMHWFFGDKELRNVYVFTGNSSSEKVNTRRARQLSALDPEARKRLHNLHTAIRDAEQKWEPPEIIGDTRPSNHVVHATSSGCRRAINCKAFKLVATPYGRKMVEIHNR